MVRKSSFILVILLITDLITIGYAQEENITPPAAIVSLRNTTYEQTYINWVWTDPSEKEVIIYSDPNLTITIKPDTVRFNNYVDNLTGQSIDQLEFELIIRDIIGKSPKSVQQLPENVLLTYKSENNSRTDSFNLKNDSYEGKIRVDLEANYDSPFGVPFDAYPFEYDNATVSINRDLNLSDKTLYISARDQTERFTFNLQENKINIKVERKDKKDSQDMYYLGVVIIWLYWFFFLISYVTNYKSLNNLNVFTTFIYIGQFLFIAIVIAGMKGHNLFTSFTGRLFIIPIVLFIISVIGLFLYRRFRTKKTYSDVTYLERL